MFRLTLIIAAALVSPLALLSQTAQNNSFAGTWNLNVAKSKFKPGPGLKSETVIIPEGNGKVEVHEVSPEGKEINWSYGPSPSEGAAMPIEGMEGATVIVKNTSDEVVDHTWKLTDFTGSGHGVLSKDGKVITYTMTGTNGQGKPVHNVMIFEKQ